VWYDDISIPLSYYSVSWKPKGLHVISGSKHDQLERGISYNERFERTDRTVRRISC
jgi:hypothetical protein